MAHAFHLSYWRQQNRPDGQAVPRTPDREPETGRQLPEIRSTPMPEKKPASKPMEKGRPTGKVMETKPSESSAKPKPSGTTTPKR